MRTDHASRACLSLCLLALTGCLLTAPARAQPCLGLPHDPGDHDVGALIETETGYTLLAGRYAGSSRALAWRAHAGGVSRDFPGDLRPAFGGGIAWLGLGRATCPAIGFDAFDEDPEAFSEVPGDSDRNVSILSLGWGAGFSFADSLRPVRAILYIVPQVRWVRVATTFGDVEDTETDRQLAFEAGITVAGRRLWAGGGGRVRYRENNDYPLDAVLQVRGGVRW